MKKILTLLAFCSCIFTLHAQQQGKLDLSFDPGSGFDGDVYALAVQPDGKIVTGGSFSSFNGNTNYSMIARLNEDGTIDTTFMSSSNNGFLVFALALQPDGKVLVGGLFVSINGQSGKNIARLNNDGTIDTSFHPGTGFNNSVYAFAVQPDGKIIVGGSFTKFNGVTCNRIVRLNADGTLDASFNTGTGLSSTVQPTPVAYAFALQPDGNVIVGGDFTSYNGSACNYIVRLKKDGTVDPTFNPGTGFDNYPDALALQPDGKVVVGGLFTTFNGATCNLITRLNGDGSLDASFLSGTGITNAGGNPFGSVTSLALQDDGKIYIGGTIVAYNGTSARMVLAVDSNGILDTTFNNNMGSSFQNYVLSLALQPDEKIIVGGGFTSFDNTNRNRIARLYGDNNIRTNIVVDSYCSGQDIEVPFMAAGLYNSGNVFTAQLSDANGSFASPVAIGTITGTASDTILATIPSNTPSGNDYHIRVVSDNPTTIGKSNEVNLNIENLPAPVITVSGFVLSTAGSYATYQWMFNGSIIPGATQSNYTINANGDYQVIVSNDKGCTDTSGLYPVSNYTGIENIAAIGSQISVYPNPVQDMLYIKAPVKINAAIFSLEGKTIRQQKEADRISVNELSAGIYFLRITDLKGQLLKVEKLVKQ